MTSDEDETEELRTFLRDNASSFEKLETSLFFVRAPRRAWSATDISLALHLPEEVVASALEGLVPTSEVIERTSSSGQPRGYRPPPAQLFTPLLDKLRSACDEERLMVLQIMTANSMDGAEASHQ